MSEVAGRSAGDVRCWPHDARARRALEEYFGQPATGPAGVQMLEVPLEARGLDFSGADLSGLDLECAVFYEATLADVRMVGVDLDHAWLICAELTGADLSGADLVKTHGRYCRAPYAKLHAADLQKSDFDHADFLGAELDGARIRLTSFAEADLRHAGLRKSPAPSGFRGSAPGGLRCHRSDRHAAGTDRCRCRFAAPTGRRAAAEVVRRPGRAGS